MGSFWAKYIFFKLKKYRGVIFHENEGDAKNSLLQPSKNGLSFPFKLGKKTIYLETQLKGEFTDLFWKLPGCYLFPQAEYE